MIYNGFILAILLFLSSGAAGQSYYFRHYQVEDGLSNNAVLSCLQDSKGFIWFGTKDGLNRFDGYTFKVFRNDPEDKTTIGNNFIHCLYMDNNHVLWAGTDKGLYKYDESNESFSLLPTPFTAQVTSIKMDTRGALWFISNFNLFRYDVATSRLQQFNVENYFEATSICTLADSAVWVSTSTGHLEKYDPRTGRFASFDLFRHSPRSVSNWIENLYATTDGNMLVGTSNQGVKIFNTASADYEDVLTYNPDHTEIFARSFLQTSPSECWIATESGIYIYDLHTRESTHLHKDYTNPYSISDNAVYSFCRDKEGGIWAGTYFGGINYFPQQPVTFTKYFPEKGRNSISGNVVREIIEDRYGKIWIGTEDAGLNQLDTATGQFTNYLPTGTKDGISYSNIHGLLATGDELWIGTFEHGLDVMNIRTGKVIRKYAKGNDSNRLRSNFIYCLYQTADDEIMVGTTIGAYLYSRKSDDFALLPGMPLHNWYTSIVKDKKGVIWAATYGNGVNYYDTKTRTGGNFSYQAGNKNSLSHDRVNKIFEDSQDHLWFATEGGLCRLNPQTRQFKRFSTADGLPSNFILSIAEDSEGRLWISTTKGLVCFNRSTEQVAAVYTKANGLLNDQFNFSSAFRDRNGNMYFGSVKGLISFQPGKLLVKDFSSPIYITGFQVNNKELVINKQGSPLGRSITFTNKVVLAHGQSTFSIDFASLSYTAPEMSEYAYKMEGLDADWTYLKTNRKVYFTNLAPGDYTFRVKAAGSRETRLVIDILPPWWASRWAYTGYTALALLLTWYITRAYRLRLKDKERRRIEQLEIAKEKELYEAKMQFFTNVAHEIKTPLTLIKGPLEKVIRKAGDDPGIKDSLRIMERNTDRLVDLTNQLLDFRQTEIKGFSLSFTEANISGIVEEIFTSFRPLAEQKGLAFSLYMGTKDIYAFIDTDAFNKILANLLSNAVKYAKSKVALHIFPLRSGDRSFVIEVKNDGYLIPMEMKDKIFEPFFRLKATEKQKGTGIGLALSLSLTQLHKGNLILKEPEDDMNVFLVSIPLNQVAV
ncbi:two-component regulator propeller domain-containing protein [Flavitalea sp. BT771]|uniref:ligand-binding sensor domain-containing protein n=1 Tax=Flavitalea sp. BT771 TaxID=3063329 RepID=UPI0026E409F6|nr:sensor histidine kinase [Flavitalea sp. BT771]MDO6432823.1 two-component regulator propeller domain-containing protein [Flavitalea sp. BT771]MDV6221901.1 two-component regulator propeller domain-containing protein [Flavitalea sp. BT771]